MAHILACFLCGTGEHGGGEDGGKRKTSDKARGVDVAWGGPQVPCGDQHQDAVVQAQALSRTVGRPPFVLPALALHLHKESSGKNSDIF